MAGKKVIDKQFKLDAVQYRKNHPELTFEQVAKNLGISNSSIHRWCKQFSIEMIIRMKIKIYLEDQAIFQVMMQKNLPV